MFVLTKLAPASCLIKLTLTSGACGKFGNKLFTARVVRRYMAALSAATVDSPTELFFGEVANT